MNQEMRERFYNLLFEPREEICISYDIYGTAVFPIRTVLHETWNRNFFSINPLLNGRLDANVTCFRNILIEFDSIPLEQQLVLLKDIPWSTVVFSGKKSYHAIISLQEPCETREEYDAVVRRILEKLPDADRSTKNPSRLSRAPGALRDGIEQSLHAIGGRISKERLDAWLGPEKLKTEQSSPAMFIPGDRRFLRGSTLYFLMAGAPEGEWNRQLFLAALDLARAGHEADETIDRLRQVTGHLDKKDMSTIKSAIKVAQKEVL